MSEKSGQFNQLSSPLITTKNIRGVDGIYLSSAPDVNILKNGIVGGTSAVSKDVELRINGLETLIENLKKEIATKVGVPGPQGIPGLAGERGAEGREGLPGKAAKSDVEILRDLKDIDVSDGLEDGHVLVRVGTKWKAMSREAFLAL